MIPRWAVLAVFAGAALVAGLGLTSPFSHKHENVAACYLNWTRHFAERGLADSRLAPVSTVDPARPPGRVPPAELYSHRPPTVTLACSLFVAALGPTEAAIRLAGLASFLGLLAVFWPLARRILGETDGAVALALLGLVPIASFFGVVVAHQTLGVLGSLATILAYLRWREEPTSRRAWALGATAFAASWLDWPGTYASAAVAVLHLATSRERRAAALIAPLGTLLGVGLFLLYLLALDPEGGVAMKDFFATGGAHRQPVAAGAYAKLLFSEAIRGFTIPLLLLAALGATALRPRSSPQDVALIAVAGLGLDFLLFPSLTSGHPFLILPWAPFLALAGAKGLRRLMDRGTAGRVVAALACAAFLGQSALMLVRMHRGGPYPAYAEAGRELGRALNLHVAPGETALVRGHFDPHLAAYYANRRIARWSSRDGVVEHLDRRRRDEGLDEAALRERLSRPGHGYAWFVTATRASLAGRLPELEAAAARAPDPDGWLKSEWDLGGDSALLSWLRATVPCTVVDGFLFFDLRR